MVHIKICGATQPADIDLLAGFGIDLVGLWHGVPDGHAELSGHELTMLAGAARANGTVHPVLVTLLSDVEAIRAAVRESGVDWIQLHGYQPPAVVRMVKAAVPPGLTVVKVLHVREGACLERTLIRSYERAGVDFFLLDAVSEGGRIGSTARPLAPGVVVDLAERMSRPFFLAGGISAHNRADYDEVTRQPRFFGIDVDTNARGPDGTLHAGRVEAIRQRWGGGDGGPAADQEMVA